MHRVAPAQKRLALAAAPVLAAGLLAACSGSETVARVGDEEISEAEVERMVEFYGEEAKREGREVPAEGSDARHRLELRLLGLLVNTERLEQAAADRGVHLSEEEVAARVERGREAEGEGEGEGEEGEAHETYIENAVRAQLVKEKVAALLGRDGLERWLDEEPPKIPVEYEEGWSP